MAAISMKKVKIAEKLLMDNRTNMEISGPKNKNALIYSIIYNLPAITKLMIEINADVNIKDNQGTTPLMFATEYSDIDLFKQILDRSENISVADTHGQTALNLADRLKYHEKKDLLVKHAATLYSSKSDATEAIDTDSTSPMAVEEITGANAGVSSAVRPVGMFGKCVQWMTKAVGHAPNYIHQLRGVIANSYFRS